MKTHAQVVGEVTTRLTSGWNDDVADGTSRWPHRFPLGAPSSAAADQTFGAVAQWAHRWHDWASAHDLALDEKPRRIRGISQKLPTHLKVPDVDTAARLAGQDWVARIVRARARLAAICERFPTADAARVLRLADSATDTDFALALDAARWFASTPESRWRALTPRQVPIPGLHAKWLERNRHLVRSLAGLDELAMAARPTRVYWTYLDADYRRTGARTCDSLTLGDRVPLPYEPTVVLVVENKDTAVLFPELPGGIAVEGNGNAATGLMPQVPWIRTARTLIYWGDIDQRGFEIVDGLRSRIHHLRTILMDRPTYDAFEEFGTEFEPNGKPVKLLPRKALSSLTPSEREMYDSLSDPKWAGHRRFEQERVPLPTALAHVRRVMASAGSGGRQQDSPDLVVERGVFHGVAATGPGGGPAVGPAAAREVASSLGAAGQTRPPSTSVFISGTG